MKGFVRLLLHFLSLAHVQWPVAATLVERGSVLGKCRNTIVRKEWCVCEVIAA